MQAADVSAGDLEGQAAQAGRDRAGARVEGDAAEGAAAEHSSREHSRCCDQGARPRAEHDDRRYLHGGGESEALPLHGLARSLAVRFLEQLYKDGRGEKEGERRRARRLPRP